MIHSICGVAVSILMLVSVPLFADQENLDEQELWEEIVQIKERLGSLEEFRVSTVTNCDYTDFENNAYPWVIHDVTGLWTRHIGEGDYLEIEKNGQEEMKDQFRVIRNRDPSDPWSQGTWTGECSTAGPYVLSGEGINIGGCLHAVRLVRMPPHAPYAREFRMNSLGDGKAAEGQPADICTTHHEGDVGVRHPGSAHGGND